MNEVVLVHNVENWKKKKEKEIRFAQEWRELNHKNCRMENRTKIKREKKTLSRISGQDDDEEEKDEEKEQKFIRRVMYVFSGKHYVIRLEFHDKFSSIDRIESFIIRC